MTERGKQIRYNAAAFGLLFLVSLYRQLSLRYLPQDPARTYILYGCYVILIGCWIFSLKLRITVRGMRVFLIADALVMLTGLTIRFLQDTFWEGNILLTRVSGLWIQATILPMLTLGFFASLYIGQPEGFRLPGKWYLLLIPVLIMVFLAITDERHHFMFYVLSEEPQPNLSFHPFIGTFLVLGLAMLMVISRVLLIYRRNRSFEQTRFMRWFIPAFEPLLTVAFSFSYFVVSLGLIPALAGLEVIELFAKIYYTEVLTWEFYIYIGLAPANTDYRDVFEHATIGMQLIRKNGTRIRSTAAEEVSEEQLKILEKEKHIQMESGMELYTYPMDDGIFLWNRDVSQLRNTIEQLRQNADTLAQEGALLEEEWKMQEKEARLAARNQIYNELAEDVRTQLEMIQKIATMPEMESMEKMRRLAILGTYVKRRCNLQLIQRDQGRIPSYDVQISFQDLLDALKKAGISTELQWSVKRNDAAPLLLYAFGVLEELMEQTAFSATRVLVEAVDREIRIRISSGEQIIWQGVKLPEAPGSCVTEAHAETDGILVAIREGVCVA